VHTFLKNLPNQEKHAVMRIGIFFLFSPLKNTVIFFPLKTIFNVRFISIFRFNFRKPKCLFVLCLNLDTK
jgi:hypothetical protein